METNVNGCNFFYMEEFSDICASYTVPCQMPFCQTATLLPSVLQQQNVMEYWWEGSASAAIPPASASVIRDQCNEIGGITFGEALVDLDLLLAEFFDSG